METDRTRDMSTSLFGSKTETAMKIETKVSISGHIDQRIPSERKEREEKVRWPERSVSFSTYTTLVLANIAGNVPRIGGKRWLSMQIRMRTAMAYGVHASRKPARNELCLDQTLKGKIITDDKKNSMSKATFNEELSTTMGFS